MIIKSVKRSKIVSNALYHVIITAFSFAMIYPLLWMIGSSFKFNEEIFVNVRRILPTKWTITNYTTGWAGFGGNSFALFFKNSFFVTILVTIGTVLSSSFIAFGFARIRFRGRSFWFVMMIITMLLPGQVMIIPRYVMFNNMGWVGTFLPLIIPPFFGGAFNIFLIMQFIRGIPRDMDESAKIDGCSWYGIYWRILLPLVVPALVTVGVLAFIGSWEDFMGSLLYLNTPRKYTVAYALKLFNDTQKTDYGATFAMSALSMVPVLILFFFFQKHLVEGISMQGIKG